MSLLRPQHEYDKYRYDANYYRLKYQLATQLLHFELVGEKPMTAAEISPGETNAKMPSPTTAAQVALDESEAIVAELQPRKVNWFPGRRLNEGDKRLLKFMERTIVPCLKIVVAAAERKEHPKTPPTTPKEIGEAVKRQETWDPGHVSRSDKRKPPEPKYSYRTIYNLACYYADKNEEDSNRAYRYLADALRLAPQGRGKELARWAWIDPSLKDIRDGEKEEDFKKVVGPKEKDPGQAASAEPKPE